MAETKQEVVILDPKTAERRSTVEEMKHLRKNPLDVAKKPGGYFIRLDGTARNAKGQKIPIDPEDLAHVNELRALKGLPEVGKKRGGKAGPDLTSGTDDEEQEATEPAPAPIDEDAETSGEAPRGDGARSVQKKASHRPARKKAAKS